ncbi:hypothetical protein E2C01_030253 [Portunus trituberculatus]|uniref:Uncharacterized protein n=1 Tax=Portunus trituberculatus TaxID=210409 RepID=A0A5B7EWT4_PORTR|nr:hypothetical protein [Portunus trituberculatus]
MTRAAPHLFSLISDHLDAYTFHGETRDATEGCHLLEESSHDEDDSPTTAASDRLPARLDDNIGGADCALINLSIISEEGQQEQQQHQDGDGDQGQEWTAATRGRHARHQQLPRPKFKLGSQGDDGNAYQGITALKHQKNRKHSLLIIITLSRTCLSVLTPNPNAWHMTEVFCPWPYRLKNSHLFSQSK